MKINRSGVLIFGGLCILFGIVGLGFWNFNHFTSELSHQVLSDSASDFVTASTNPPLSTNSFTIRAVDMTPEVKAILTNEFEKKFKPAAEKWLNAYAGHVPFKIKDFTLDKFHSRLGSHLYTFMINPDTTFTIQDSKNSAKVVYLMSRKSAVALNQLPQNGAVPDFTVPVQRENIMQMVQTDSGMAFKPNEILIKPTAAASALNGGAFVDVLPAGADPNNGLSYKISMVFDSHGNLVNYERDPFF